ncbi:YdeI/OmpD-associated family protein [Nonomuraea sp. SYSU D8015]|uniref:YdeI/OmpD-associated family protein n=1 Tax=Nonomuraea sp. SYSU D8015 TaxID=2593644 RepID=UPI001CB7214B|nr:YdeI/OmpD-associated family protein [Nonomuraea sp. SYSU D8015]
MIKEPDTLVAGATGFQGRWLVAELLTKGRSVAAAVRGGSARGDDLRTWLREHDVVEPADFARALDADPVARAVYDRLAYSHKREHVLAIESAKKPETRIRRIEKALEVLRDREDDGMPSAGSAVGPSTSPRPTRATTRLGLESRPRFPPAPSSLREK